MKNLKVALRQTLLPGLLLFIALLFASIGVHGTAAADTAAQNKGTVDLLVDYCKEKAPKKLDASCTQDRMTDVRNAAEQTDKCDGKTADGDLAGCILSEGKRITKSALSGADSGHEFQQNLTKIYQKEHLDPSKQTDAAQQNKTATTTGGDTFKTKAPGGDAGKGDTCGGGQDSNGQDYKQIDTTIAIGCKGKGNPIADLSFAIIRFLSNGVGLVIIASFVVGGIQYAASRDDPNSVAIAVNRLRNTVFALLLYIFGYAILNFLIPAGFLK